MNLTRTLSLSLLLAAGAAAQNVVYFPSDHATIANGTGSQNWFPYSDGVSRMMALYEAWDIGVPANHQITAIGFRLDGTATALGKSLQLEVRMGQTTRTATTAVANFDNNYTGTPQTVFGPALFVMPNLTPANPIIWLQLTTPFTFDPTYNLLVEWRITANSSGGTAFNYPLDRAAFVSPVVTGVGGCPHSGGPTPQLESRPTKIGGTWYEDLTTAPAGQPVILFMNAGLPLSTPFPLDLLFPGVQPTCLVNLSGNSLFSMASTTTAQGSKTFSVAIPYSLALNDFVISSQAFCFDFFAPGGLVTSNGDQVQFGVDPAMSIIWHQGSATNATGSVYPNWGIVTLFDHN